MRAPRDSGWYEDPFGRHLRRWFDGGRWTDQVQTKNGDVATDLVDGTQASQQPAEWTGLTAFQQEVKIRRKAPMSAAFGCLFFLFVLPGAWLIIFGTVPMAVTGRDSIEDSFSVMSWWQIALIVGWPLVAVPLLPRLENVARRVHMRFGSAEKREIRERRLAQRLDQSRAAKKLAQEKNEAAKSAMRKFTAGQRQRTSHGLQTGVKARVPQNADDFESVCEEWLRANGIDAKRTAKGPDGGLDVIGPNLAAQCKMFASGKVGSPDIQKLHGAAAEAKKTRKLVFTYGEGFTPQAVESARKLGVELWRFDPDRQTFRREN